MAAINYDTLDGEIYGQSTGGVRTDFLTDALGSVTATVDSTGSVVNTYRNKPSGQQLAKTGSGIDPKFLWTGATGSRKTGLGGSDYYNRARHYGSSHASWTSVDPLWPSGLAYVYAYGNPTTWIDPSGFQRRRPLQPGPNGFPPGWRDPGPSGPTDPRSPGPNAPSPAPSDSSGDGPSQAVTIIIIGGILITGGIAVGDLARYVCTGKTGPFTSIGDKYGHDLFDDPNQMTYPLYIPTPGFKPNPSCDKTGLMPGEKTEANKQVHKYCDIPMTNKDPNFFRERNTDLTREDRCWQIRVWMSRARNCYRARIAQERACGYLDDEHVEITERYKELKDYWRGKFRQYNCQDFL